MSTQEDQHSEVPDRQSNKKSKIVGFYNAEAALLEQEADRILWNDFRLGSKQAFSGIFLKYNPQLISFGKTMGFDQETTEDCIQDLFLNLWRTRQDIGEADSVKYYLVISLRRALLKLREKEDRLRKLWSEITHDLPDSDNLESINLPAQQTFLKKINPFIEALPPRQREAISLRYFQGKSYEEITQTMSISMVSARKLVYKGIKTLRKKSDRLKIF